MNHLMDVSDIVNKDMRRLLAYDGPRTEITATLFAIHCLEKGFR